MPNIVRQPSGCVLRWITLQRVAATVIVFSQETSNAASMRSGNRDDFRQPSDGNLLTMDNHARPTDFESRHVIGFARLNFDVATAAGTFAVESVRTLMLCHQAARRMSVASVKHCAQRAVSATREQGYPTSAVMLII